MDRLQASVVGCFVAECITLPIDTTKVRLQIQNNVKSSASVQYAGMTDAGVKILRSEGLQGLFKGLSPALLRQCSYTGLAFVLFDPIKKALVGDADKPSFANRLLAGGMAGGIGIAIMNPTEVVKTRMQGSIKERLTMTGVTKEVFRKDGILGFWAGVWPNIGRCFLVNAAELGTYDQAKHFFVEKGWTKEGTLANHLGASFAAAVTSTAVSTPTDVVKTRLMNQAGHAHQYRGMIDAFTSIFRIEGPLALYKGVVPILWRKVIWCGAFFVVYERALEFVHGVDGEE